MMSVLLNFGFLAVWFVCLWLLLRFQWSHALGLAVAFWAAMTLFVLPPLLTRAEEVARQRAGTKTAALLPGVRRQLAAEKRSPNPAGRAAGLVPAG